MQTQTGNIRRATRRYLSFGAGLALIALITVTATVANAAPMAVSMSGIAQGQTYAGSLTWTGNVGNVIPNRVSFSIDGTVVGTDSTYVYTYALDTTTLSNGSHTFTVTAYPNSGTSGSVSATVTANVNNPVMAVSMSGIAQGQTYAGSLTWTGNVGNVIPNRVSFSIDGTVVGTDSTYVYTYALDTTTLSNGSHTFTVTAYPNSGTTGSVSATVTATVSNTAAMTVSMSGIASGQNLSGNVTWTGNVTGGTPNRVEFAIEGTVVGTDSSYPYTINLDTTTATNGVDAFTVTAYPNSGMSGAVSTTVDATVANPLAIYMNNISEGQTLAGNVTWGGGASNAYVNRVSFSIDGTVVSTDATYIFSYALDTTTLSNGSHTFTVTAYPDSGTTGSASKTVTATVNNASSLVVSMSGIASGQTLSGNVTWTGNVTGGTPNRVEFAIDGTVVGTDSTAPYTYALDTTAVSNGSHTFKVTAYPNSGTSGSVSASVTATVNAMAVSMAGIASGQTYSGSLTWTGNVGIVIPNRVVFSIDGTVVGTDTTYVYTYSLDTTTLSNGSHTFTVTAYPDSSTIGSVSATVTASVNNAAVVPPSATAPPVISGTPTVGLSLTTSTGSWTGTAPITYTYQWQRCDSSGASCTSISGATASSYIPVSGDYGFTLRVTVTATNSAGSAGSQSATTSSVASGSCSGFCFSGWNWDAVHATIDLNSTPKMTDFYNYAVAPPPTHSVVANFMSAVAWARASAGTPTYSIPVTGQSTTSITAPIPVNTEPGNTNDRSLYVIAADGTEYDFGKAVYDSTSGKLSSTDGAATVPAGSPFETGPCLAPGNCNSGNAARFPLAAGPITPSDIQSGVINHPLVISIPNVGPAPNPYPANAAVGYPQNTGVPLGSWIRLDPNLNVGALFASNTLEYKIAVAMQHYGMFVRDIGSSLCIIATDEINQQGGTETGNKAAWESAGVTLSGIGADGVSPYIYRLDSTFPWHSLQLLDPPPQ